MRILVIVSSIGRSAAGIVAEEIFSHLIVQNPETHIFCNQNFSKRLFGENITDLGLSPIHHNRKDKFLMMATHKEWNGRHWVKKGLLEFKKLKNQLKPDVVLSFISAYGFRELELGYRISKECNIPFAIHAVDPLPSTPAWGEHPLLRRAIISIIKPYYQQASLISATNEAMLNYQLDVLGLKGKKKTAVIYNPAKPPEASAGNFFEPNSFLYLGTLYKKRNPQLIIDAFIDFLKEEKNSKFYFVGNNRCPNLFIPKEHTENVVFINWTENPDAYIEKAKTLVDIDADIHGDVFISSKLTQYLMYDKPVLCITPKGSPAERLTKSLSETVFCVNHTKDDILIGLQKTFKGFFNEASFSERIGIRSKFVAENISRRLLKNISCVV